MYIPTEEDIQQIQIGVFGKTMPYISKHRLLSALSSVHHYLIYGYDERGSFKEHLIHVSYLLISRIINNHAFVDGNKRTALATMHVTIMANGFELDTTNQLEYVQFAENVVGKNHDERKSIQFLRERIRKY